jgi:hypothetical protein
MKGGNDTRMSGNRRALRVLCVDLINNIGLERRELIFYREFRFPLFAE